METRRDVIVAAARLADELGYEVFAVPEGWGLDSTAVLAEIALSTRRITAVSGVLSVWGRTPASLAMTAATLHQLSGGRYVLGLGASTKALVEGFHGLPFVRPAAKLRDTMAKVRALLNGQRAQLDTGSAARPIRLGLSPAPEVPIWLAAMSEHTVAVTAELADGWFPIFVTPERLGSWTKEMRRIRDAAGRHAEPMTVAAGPMTVADQDPDTAHRTIASCVAWYLCAMGDVYANAVARQGYPAAVAAIRDANPKPSPRLGLVPADAQVILDEFTAYGTPRQVRDRLERWDTVADVLMIGLPPGLPWNGIETTLRAAAPGASASR